MRQQYSGPFGHSQYSGPTQGFAGGEDRLANIKRAIESIEQRLATSAVQASMAPPQISSPMMMPQANHFAQASNPAPVDPSAAQIGLLQDEIRRLSNQVMSPSAPAVSPPPASPTPPAPSTGAGLDDLRAATEEIVQRQKMLKSSMAKPSAPAAAPAATQQVSATPPAETRSDVAASLMKSVTEQLQELKAELSGLKQEVAKPVAVKQDVPQADIDRIAKAVAELQESSAPDEEAFEKLQSELDAMRRSLKDDVNQSFGEVLESVQQSVHGVQQSVEETAKAQLEQVQIGQAQLEMAGRGQLDSVATRIDALAAEMEALSKRPDEPVKPMINGLMVQMDALARGIDTVSLQSANTVQPLVDNLASQLDSLRMSVDDLPQTLAITRLEDRLSEMAARIETLSQPQETPEPSVHAGLTSDDLATIEGRLDEISRALVAVSNSNSKAPSIDLSAVDRVEARIAELGRTLDSVAQKDNASELEQLAVRIDGLTERLGSFEKYAQNGDLGGANAMFAAPDIGVIEEQLRALNARVEEAAVAPQTAQLEHQIQQLYARVEEAANANSTAAQMSNLEAQIGEIIRHMNNNGGSDPVVNVDFAPVEMRLGQIEEQLTTTQNISLEAAQQAAQQAVSMMGTNSESAQIIDALTQDLRALQAIAENGNAQNVQTVNEVQHTLQQVVERLHTIEGAIESTAHAAEVREATLVEATIGQMPSPTMLVGEAVEQLGLDKLALNAAGPAPVEPGPFAEASQYRPPEQPPQPGVIQQAAVETGFVDAPPLDPTDHLESAMKPHRVEIPEDNQPLEPGSAAPNIERLVEQASAQLGETQAELNKTQMPPAPDATIGGAADIRPDAVAAARRALQATTAEMNAVREEVGQSKKSALSDIKGKADGLLSGFDVDRLRKPVVIATAAVLLAVVAFVGHSIFAGDDETPMAKAPVIEQSATEPQGDVAALPQTNVQSSDDAKVAANVAASSERPSAETDQRSVRSVDGAEPADQERNALSQTASDVAEASSPDTPASSAENPPTVETANANQAEGSSQPDSGTQLAAADPTPAEDVEPESQAATPSKYEIPSNAGPAALIAAAASGDQKALFQLGMRYSDGQDVKRNMTESARWFQQSAELGFAPAQYSIGSLYEKGIGVKRDVPLAAQWYEKAAAQGNARAMHNLAVINAMGNPPEIQPNMDNAVEWFKKAADYGIKDSQFNLGIMYGQGMGVPQDLSKSYKWFALAAKTGDTDASKKRDEVANAMDPDDLDDARTAVNQWKPQKLNDAVNRVSVPKTWTGKATGTSATSASAPVDGKTLVQRAQAMLNERGFNVGTPDGLMGPKTQKAIMEFQRSAGIPVTGKVDTKLISALDIQT